MITNQQIEKLKTQFGHAFDVDNKGNMTLKNDFDIPQFKLIYIEGGEFTMGDNSSNYGEEKPEHKVEVSSFFMAEYQLTQEIYKAVTGKEPSHFKGINHPVEQVSWIDAVNFCNILNKKLGLTKICNKDYNLLDKNGNKTNNIIDVKGFRLPTEAEWEFAARGGVKTRHGVSLSYAGSNFIDEVAWYRKNNGYETKTVGLKFPNALEIYDMSGNVIEWCWDWYDKGFYKNQDMKNPVNFKTNSHRVLHGSSWYYDTDYCRLANRIDFIPDGRDYDVGFRLLFAFTP